MATAPGAPAAGPGGRPTAGHMGDIRPYATDELSKLPLPKPSTGAGKAGGPSAGGPPAASPTPGAEGAAGGPAPPMPGTLTGLTAPSQRPNEPIEAGFDPEFVPPQPMIEQDPDLLLRALYQVYPHEDIRRLLES